ncbi:MAG: hypothetical protein HPZ91_16155 [Lentisphaeria bacterium]|nr:hypothetical protein [Lentisphaeria bacterium]DAU43696.1 MAG TPA: hypothetical protein [Caudoviricetes sp.]
MNEAEIDAFIDRNYDQLLKRLKARKDELRVKKERQMSKTVDGRRLLIAQKTLMVIKSLMNLHDAEVKKILLAALETVETE